MRGDDEAAAAWAASGLLALTGRPGAFALGTSRPLVAGVRSWAGQLADRSGALGTAVTVDPLGLLVERAAVAGLGRRGDISCGGGARLLRSADGWVAVSLARSDDWDLVPAWLGRLRPVADGDWETVASGVAASPGEGLRAGAALLGLPMAVLGERQAGSAGALSAAAPRGTIHGMRTRSVRPLAPVETTGGLLVVDLSSLWAGPLAGRLLRDAGARVVKVEATGRPDGARHGPASFFRPPQRGQGVRRPRLQRRPPIAGCSVSFWHTPT